jgi:hypothetical protein
MKGNTGAETGANRPVLAEELKSRSRCNGHPISMSAKNVARAFALCEKAMKTFLKLNVSWQGIFQTGLVIENAEWRKNPHLCEQFH